MDNPIVKILRFLIFFPICFIAMAIVNWGLGHLLIWFLGLSKFWFFIVHLKVFDKKLILLYYRFSDASILIITVQR